MLMFCSFVLVAVVSFYVLMKKLYPKKIRCVPPIEDVLLKPEQIVANIFSYKTPSISGYPLTILSYIYLTALGKILVARFVIPMSNLNIFSDCVLPELPSLTHSIPQPCFSEKENKRILNSLLCRNKKYPKCTTSAHYYNAYKSGQTTPMEIARAVLAAIEDSNTGEKALRAIVSFNRELILSMAETSTERWKNGSQLSVIDGVPISVKEDIPVEGYPCTCGTTFLPNCVAKLTKTSSTVQKLIDDGAIIIGLTNMPELGCGSVGSSENNVHGQPRNPHNTDFFSGGSSSGCAVSVAAGLCPISVGGDGGGSGRVPAAVCGVYSLKFTHGLMSTDVESYGSMYSFSVVSPLTSSPFDLAVYIEAVCGKKSALDFTVLSESLPSLSGLAIGVYSDWIENADKETVVMFKDAIEKMKRLGAEVKDIKIPELEELRVAHTITAVTELSSIMAEDVANHFSELGAGAILLFVMGQCFSAIESTNAMKQRTRTIKALKSIFNEVDVIATPTAGCPIPRISADYLTVHGALDGEATGKLDIFTFLASFAGLPAITIPVGSLSESLPVGLQLIAPWYRDLNLIKYALAIEDSGIFSRPSPKESYDIIKAARH